MFGVRRKARFLVLGHQIITQTWWQVTSFSPSVFQSALSSWPVPVIFPTALVFPGSCFRNCGAERVRGNHFGIFVSLPFLRPRAVLCMFPAMPSPSPGAFVEVCASEGGCDLGSTVSYSWKPAVDGFLTAEAEATVPIHHVRDSPWSG